MPKEAVLCGFFLTLASGLFVALAPGIQSLIFVLITIAMLLVGFVLGIYRVSRVNRALKEGCDKVHHVQGVQAEESWLAVRQITAFFRYEALDVAFDRYRKDVEVARSDGAQVLPDVDDYVNEEVVGLFTCRGLVLQMPGVLTGIGILGTFVGLILGVGSVGFSSVAAAVNGVESLLQGIELAFYTSIASISLSILFNMMYRMVWNAMLANLRRFVLDFQAHVIPSAQAQERAGREAFQRSVLAYLDGMARGSAR